MKQSIISGNRFSFLYKFFLFSCRQIYRLPNIYIQYQNGTWLDGPLQLNNQLYQILTSNQMQRLTTRVYLLSEAYSYFYSNPLTINDQDYLERLILTLYNQQSKSISKHYSNKKYTLFRFDNR
jgi:hypothetical protein